MVKIKQAKKKKEKKEIIDTEDQRFWSLDLDEDDGHITDLKKWINDDGSSVMEGLVDEEAGGIIGYIHQDWIDNVLKILNKDGNYARTK